MALRSTARTWSSLTGIVVMAAVLWALLNFVYAPSCGRFGCSYTPYWVPQAQADGGDGCPGSFSEAVSDEGWLRDRVASIKDEKITTGVVFDEAGEPTTFVSGRDDAAETALKVGQEAGVFPPTGRPIVVDHVEVKVATAMRTGGVKHALLVINNAAGPCTAEAPAPYTCTNMVPKLLGAGAELRVFWEDDQGRVQSRRFVGEG